MYVLETENLSYTYGLNTPFEKTAVKDVSIRVQKGEMIGIIGHTGSGKSTLIQMFNGLIRPEGGRVLLNGRDIWEDPKKIRTVRFQAGLVFQYPEYQLFEETVEKDIAFGPRNMGLSDEEIQEKVTKAARFTGLKPELLGKSPFELSGGMRKRAVIIRALIQNPDIIFMDEPFGPLDVFTRETLQKEILRMWTDLIQPIHKDIPNIFPPLRS